MGQIVWGGSAPVRRPRQVLIVAMQTAAGHFWMVFQQTTSNPISNFCEARILARVAMTGSDDYYELPTSVPAFDAHEATDCRYTGTKTGVGKLVCPAVRDIRCSLDPSYGTVRECQGGSKYMRGINCAWESNEFDPTPPET